MPSHTTHNTPALRFPGYTGVWEQHQLNDYCGQLSATLDPQKTPNSIFAEYSMPAFDNGEIPNIVTGDTMNSTRKILDRSCLLINKLNVRKKRIWLVDKPEDNAVSSAEFIPIYSDEISLKFLKYSVSNESFTTYLEECSSGSSNSQKRITPDVLMSAKLSFPSRREQDAIGQLMTVLDGLINLHQRQTQKLTKLKTGLLQNMFPREGESVPRLRFPGFTTTWKQQKLGDIATIVGGGTPATTHSEYWNGTIDWYAPAEITNQRYVSHSQRQITQLGLEKSSAQLLPAHKTVLFTSRAGIGKMAILQREAATNQGFQSLVLHDGIDPYFIYSMNAILKKKAEKIAAGSTFLEISGSHLAHIRITIPSLSEQKQIGSFFRTLDDRIHCHEQYTVKLVELKKGLLQKMFPQD